MLESKEYIRDKRSPKPLNEKVSKVMRANKAKHTVPERLLRNWFFRNGYRGYRVNYKKIPGRPDICFIKSKIAIFVHGCFWHRCPVCSLHTPKHNSDFWKQKFRKNVLRDSKKIEDLKLLGWQSIVFWECEVSPKFKKETILKINNILKNNGQII